MAERFQNGWLTKKDYAKGKTWIYTFRVVRPSDGKRCQNTRVIGLVSEFPSESTAWKEVERLTLRTEANQPKTDKPTFKELADLYEREKLSDNPNSLRDPKSKTTITRSKAVIKNYLIPRWGNRIAEDIQPREIKDWLADIKKRNQLAHQTILKIRNLMMWIYSTGQEEGIFPRHEEANPLKFVKVKTTSDYRAIVIEPKQVFAIIRELPEPLERTLTFLVAATGLRISEALGLYWGDLDFGRNMIYIRRKWTAGELGQPKTRASAAAVPMHPILAKVMESWHDATEYPNPNDFVFPSYLKEGKQPRLPGMLVKDHLRPAAARAGILASSYDKHGNVICVDKRQFGFHNLRHSIASWMVSQNIDPKTVQGMLRHAQVTTTLNLYAQTVDAKRLEAQAKLLEAMVPAGT